jgi:hypothetical protein
MAGCIAWIDDLRRYGHACLLVFLATLVALGCQGDRPDEGHAAHAPKRDSAVVKPKGDVTRRFDHILEELWDKDEKVREGGLNDLAAFQKATKNAGSPVGLKSLRAAARPYPFTRPEPGLVSGELVAVASSRPLPEYIPVVVELFDKFSDDAKERAQILLTELESRAAAEAFMTIVRTHAPTGKLPSLQISRLVQHPRHADVFFPELLRYAGNRRLSYDIYRLCLAYCGAKLVPPASLVPFTDQVLKSYGPLAECFASVESGRTLRLG